MKTIIELENERMEWSLKTFTEATAQSSIEKLKEEIKEIEKDIAEGFINPEEYADAIMCLFDSAGRRHIPITPKDIMDAYASKIAKNKNRTWKKNPDNTYSHVKNIPKECVEPDIFCCRRVKGTCEQCKNG